MKIQTAIAVLGFLFTGFTYAADSCPNDTLPLPESIKQIMQQPRYQTTIGGFYVKDLETGKVLYCIRPNNLFIPGSVSKIFATAALLNALGDNSTIKTPVYALGKVENGTLAGNLVLVGKGDLTLGGRVTNDNKIAYTNFDHIYANNFPGYSTEILTPEDPLAGIKALAKQVKASGISTIHGNVFVDDRLFEITSKRGSILSPILINENLIDFTIKPSEIGKTATLDWRPQIPQIQVVNNVTTVAKGANTEVTITPNEAGDRYIVSGTLAMDQTRILTSDIKNPTQFARNAFIAALEQEGITIDPNPNAATGLPNSAIYSELKPVAEYTSPPLIETAKLILKVSHNIGANLVPLLLASTHGKTTFDEGMRYYGQFITETAHVPASEISFADGAGGNENYVSPTAVMTMLEYLHHLPKEQFDKYLDALPILGVDGSLAEHNKQSPAKGHVFAKTGTGIIYNALQGKYFLTAEALAGYIKAQNGHLLAFVVVVNSAGLKDVMESREVAKDTANIAAEVYNNVK